MSDFRVSNIGIMNETMFITGMINGHAQSPMPYEEKLTEEMLDKWLETEVWGKRYSGSQTNHIVLSHASYVRIRYYSFINFLLRKYRFNPLSKYFWFGLRERLKDWYRWHKPIYAWYWLRNSWNEMYRPKWYEKRYDKDFNYDFKEELPGYVPPIPEEDEW